ncbi:ribosome-associated protein [Comamonas aquatica]|uniref:ribosome biogenesis factor YjgA n=1 Tax=Comamonas aquatica TaxID=225991 RepID=UPI0005EC501A|nr:ribosome biogenesis factor YjgA [Comamonas aquatica]ANY61906.1 ribosome-associated protein [Comamonas aquatica]
MSRKPKKGYYVKGVFVAEGSDRDLELKAELKGTWDATRTDLKKESDALQDLGEALLGLRPKLLERLQLPEKLVDALAEQKRLTNFEAKRRQMQFIGKLMRKLDESQVEAVKAALEEQRTGVSREQTHILVAEQWRDRLIVSDDHLGVWLDQFPATDVQQLRTLMRQVRKDDATAIAKAKEAEAKGHILPPAKKGKAYRELFQLLLAHINGTAGTAEPAVDDVLLDDEDEA